MGAKGHLTGLADANLLDDRGRARLRELSVTTVEELVGMLEAEPERLRDYLELDDSALDSLKRNASQALPETTRQALDGMPKQKRSYGARNPRLDD